MFICSLKADKNKFLGLLLIILLIAGGFVIVKSNNWFSSPNDISYATKNIYSNDDLIIFLNSFGWEVEPQPIEIVEIIIPLEFGEVYTNYNAIQKSQGLDLSKYKGQNCKRYSYYVLNYPSEFSDVRANILVYNDEIIGGDISLIRIDGFMHNFIEQSDKKN